MADSPLVSSQTRPCVHFSAEQRRISCTGASHCALHRHPPQQSGGCGGGDGGGHGGHGDGPSGAGLGVHDGGLSGHSGHGGGLRDHGGGQNGLYDDHDGGVHGEHGGGDGYSC